MKKQIPKRHSDDRILKEIVKTRCSRCKHELYCLIDPRTPSTPFLGGRLCRQRFPIGSIHDCGSPLSIVSGRGLAFRTVKIGANHYDVSTPTPEESTGHDNAQRYQTRKARFQRTR